MASISRKRNHSPIGWLIIIALCVLAYVAWLYAQKDEVYCTAGPDCTSKRWYDDWLPLVAECEARGSGAYAAAMMLKAQRSRIDFPGVGTAERDRADLCIHERGV